MQHGPAQIGLHHDDSVPGAGQFHGQVGGDRGLALLRPAAGHQQGSGVPGFGGPQDVGDEALDGELGHDWVQPSSRGPREGAVTEDAGRKRHRGWLAEGLLCALHPANRVVELLADHPGHHPQQQPQQRGHGDVAHRLGFHLADEP